MIQAPTVRGRAPRRVRSASAARCRPLFIRPRAATATGVVMKLRSHHHHMIHISYPNGRSQELCDAFGIPIHFGTKRDAMIHIEKLFSTVFRNQFEVDAYTTEGVTVAPGQLRIGFDPYPDEQHVPRWWRW